MATHPPAHGVLNTSSPPPILPDEAPPAYTPRPDYHDGEATLELGPNRPFQNATSTGAQRPQQWPQQRPQPSPWAGSSAPTSTHFSGSGSGLSTLLTSMANQLSQSIASLNRPPTTGSSWAAYPGQAHQQQRPQYAPPPGPGPPPLPHRRASLSGLNHLLSPPPRHPSSSSHTSIAASASAPVLSASPYAAPPPTSEFARDFYEAGPGAGAGSEGIAAAESSVRPSGPPAPGENKVGVSRDDGKPTTTPVPGHPLLKDGKLLVYPAGYTCHKCKNVGYKLNNPSRPCKKCWNKYGKPFTGPLVYAFSSPESNGDSSSKTFQRPLPRPAGPPLQSGHGSLHRPSASLPSSPQSYAPPPAQQYAHGSHQLAYPPHPPPRPQHPIQIQHLSPYARPPPGSVVYRPGDPRIGGRLCRRCDGTGKVSLFLFDEMQCEKCTGTGRVFP